MLAMPLVKTSERNDPLSTSLPELRPSIVLIEPTIGLLPERQYFMPDDSYRVTAVSNLRELSLISISKPFTFAVISDTLGSVGFEDAARFVRGQWPAARILVLGYAAVVLEDYLYDDVLPHTCSQQAFCEMLRAISNHRTHGRPFIVTTPASERFRLESEESLRAAGVPKRMTQSA